MAATNVTQFAKTQHNNAIFESVSSMYLKALFCNSINTILQIVYELQGLA